MDDKRIFNHSSKDISARNAISHLNIRGWYEFPFARMIKSISSNTTRDVDGFGDILNGLKWALNAVENIGAQP